LIIIKTKDLLLELATYCSINCNGYDFNYEQAKRMSLIAEKYQLAAVVLYLMQANYEDCDTVEEWLESFNKQKRLFG